MIDPTLFAMDRSPASYRTTWMHIVDDREGLTVGQAARMDYLLWVMYRHHYRWLDRMESMSLLVSILGFGECHPAFKSEFPHWSSMILVMRRYLPEIGSGIIKLLLDE